MEKINKLKISCPSLPYMLIAPRIRQQNIIRTTSEYFLLGYTVRLKEMEYLDKMEIKNAL